MAKSRETFNKKEKEQKRFKSKQAKKQKMEERKASKKNGNSLQEMTAYIDAEGNLSDVPPDPRMKKIINAEDIDIGVPKQEHTNNFSKQGVVTFFNQPKGFGFINEEQSGERFFFHVNDLMTPIKESDKVAFMAERGPRGWNAVQVTKTD